MERRGWQAFLLVLCGATVLWGQDARGRLLGVVSDPSGSPVAGARVAVTQQEMNTRFTARTNASGHYDFSYLVPGPYRVEVEADGFKRHVQQDIDVRVGDAVAVDVKLTLGQVSESLTVTEELPMLDSASASVSNTIDRKMLEDLPLAGNNAMYSLGLAGGAVMTTAPGHNWLPSAVDSNSGFAFAGGRGGQNEFSMDGISNMTRNNNAFSPPGDMIQEVRVDIANYDASTGRAGGASVNMALRSGTNQFRGSVVYDDTPERFNATDFFTNARLGLVYGRPVTGDEKRALVPKRQTRRYSVVLGGPLVLPGLYRGRNRTFWTYGFQGFNRLGGNNNLFTVPSERERGGDFSEFLNLPRDRYVIYDPTTITPAANGRYSRAPFAGNVIPASRLDPVAKKMVALYPLPNMPRDERGFSNFQNSPKDDNDIIQNMGRVDHNFSEKHRVYGRVTQSWLEYRYGDQFGNLKDGTFRHRLNWSFAADDVVIVSPTFIVNTRAGYTRFFESNHPSSLGFDLATLGFGPKLLGQLQGRGFQAVPAITANGYTAMSGGANDYFATNYYSFTSTATKLTGGHNLRVGVDFRVLQDNRIDMGDNAPAFAFATNWTRGPLDNAAAASLGQSMASFVLGLPTGGGVDTNGGASMQSKYLAVFVQDDWRVSRRLTVNAGLRWEFDMGPTERYDRAIRGFNQSVANPVSAAAGANYAASPIPEIAAGAFRTPGVLTFANRDGQPRYYFGTHVTNLAPRFGLAFQVTRKTLLRTGYGIFIQPIGIDRAGIVQNGFNLRTPLNPSLDTGQTFQATLQNPFPNGIQLPTAVGPATWVGRTTNFWIGVRPNPYMQRWSFSLQRQLGGKAVGELTYVGSRATRLGATRAANALPAPYWSTTYPFRDATRISYLTTQVTNPFFGIPEFAGTTLGNRQVGRQQLLRPYPQYVGLNYNDPVGFSWYHSLMARVQRRYAHGLTLLGTYTWSKNMEATSFLNEFDAMPEHVISDLDRSHRVVASGVWEFPVGRGKRFGRNMNRWVNAVAGGWQYQAIYQFQVGSPVAFPEYPYFGDFRSIALPGGEQTLTRWFNTSDFVLTASRQVDWNVRSFPSRLAGLRNPHDNYWDMSAMKTFRVKERIRAQLRTTWEGALNHPQFNPVATGTANFGQITAIRGNPRRVFLGTRVTF